ncbi:MAG: adenylate kinase family protein [Sulfolobales archaeon]
MTEDYGSGKAIAISGTPGTGKSVVGTLVSRSLDIGLVELSDFVLENKLVVSYDDERLSFVIDEHKLREHLRRLIAERGRVLVIGHYSEIIDDDVLDKIIILRINPVELAERLSKRGWPPKKVLENVEAELLGVCTSNALLEHPPNKVCEVDVTGKSVEDVSKEVIEIVTGRRSCRVFIDWLSDEAVVNSVLSLTVNH